MLREAVHAAPSLACTYCRPMSEALLPILRSASAGNLKDHVTQTEAMLAIGELLSVAGERLEPYSDELLLLFLQARARGGGSHVGASHVGDLAPARALFHPLLLLSAAGPAAHLVPLAAPRAPRRL